MLDLVTLDCVIDGVGVTNRMLPDSSVDAIISCEDVEKNASKLMNALTVSGKYQEIVSSSESSSEIAVDCKHIYSGIVVHLRVTRSCNSSFSGFIKYAKRISGFKELYICFRYYLRNNNITSNTNTTMIMSLMVIYYLQVTLELVWCESVTSSGHGDNLSLGDLFLNLLDSVVHFSYLMPAIGNQPRQGFSFMGYLKGVQSKLGIQLDLSSKEALHTMKVGTGEDVKCSVCLCCVRMEARCYITFWIRPRLKDVWRLLSFMTVLVFPSRYRSRHST